MVVKSQKNMLNKQYHKYYLFRCRVLLFNAAAVRQLNIPSWFCKFSAGIYSRNADDCEEVDYQVKCKNNSEGFDITKFCFTVEKFKIFIVETNTYWWPDNADEAWIGAQQIIKKLGRPLDTYIEKLLLLNR